MQIKRHNSIVTFVAGKMQKLGFTIKYLEGEYINVTTQKPALPPKIITHRPDAYGIKIDGAICIGEAKTANDLGTLRTKKQLLDFRKLVKEHPESLLIIGISFGMRANLEQLLNKLGIPVDQQIDIMEIPEHFLTTNE